MLLNEELSTRRKFSTGWNCNQEGEQNSANLLRRVLFLSFIGVGKIAVLKTSKVYLEVII